MKLSSVEAVVRAFNQAQVPFIVVGGIAVVAHGYGRQTQDLDVVVRLEPEIISRMFAALASLGYSPRVPITADSFADPRQRESWIRDKGMKVLAFYSDQHRATPVDIFVAEPFDFAAELRSARTETLAPGVRMPILRLEALIRLKRDAGRAQDLADIEELRRLHGGPTSA